MRFYIRMYVIMFTNSLPICYVLDLWGFRYSGRGFDRALAVDRFGVEHFW